MERLEKVVAEHFLLMFPVSFEESVVLKFLCGSGAKCFEDGSSGY